MTKSLGRLIVIVLAFVSGIIANSLFKIEQPAESLTTASIINDQLLKIVKYPSHISLKGLPVEERKKRFIQLLVPLIKQANREVLSERAFILKVKDKKDKKELTEKEKQELSYLKKKYRAKSLKELLLKVNSVPVSLILAQGAIESGWGTSRFFTEANNIFGIYSFKGAKCLKAKNSKACLKVYDNLYSSVKDYIYNLNVGWAYRRFRELRAKGADIFTLAESLDLYSTRKKEYVELVKNVVKKNHLERFDEPELASNGMGTEQ